MSNNDRWFQVVPGGSQSAGTGVVPGSLPYGGEPPPGISSDPVVIPTKLEPPPAVGGRSGRCKDCAVEGVKAKRPAPYPGPRCTTHHRAKRKRDKLKAAQGRVEKTYGIDPGAYEAMLRAQHGGCGWCGRKPRAGGRRLAVDHDHGCCPGPVSCGKCVRGLLCWTCNKMLQHLGDDPGRVSLGVGYLLNPPAKSVLTSGSNAKVVLSNDDRVG